MADAIPIRRPAFSLAGPGATSGRPPRHWHAAGPFASHFFDALSSTFPFGEAFFVRSVLGDAISVACFGIVGTAFCIGAHAQAKRLAKARMESSDRMVERLEALIPASASLAS